ncbi:MAG TPA: type II secretion system F family protein, partial [Polyangia bacterium]|nr:type II secretion system F family protein [Polyangia bacterium]
AAIFFLEAIYYSVRYLSDKRADELKRRLQSLETVAPGSIGLLRQGNLSASPALDALLRVLPFTRQLHQLLEQAEVEVTVARWLTYSVLAGAGAAMVGGLLVGVRMALLLGPLGGLVPLGFVLFARERRNRKMSEQLPDALDMMARSLRAGHALAGAFKMVASELPPPISVEFARAFEEQNLGVPFERAVVQMTQRNPKNRELKMFAVSVILQKETGGNLVEIIESIAETVRQRYRFFGKLATLTAESRMSSYVLGALPILSGALMAASNPPYFKLFITTSTGNHILAYAVVTWVLGFLWMWRMAKVAL